MGTKNGSRRFIVTVRDEDIAHVHRLLEDANSKLHIKLTIADVFRAGIGAICRHRSAFVGALRSTPDVRRPRNGNGTQAATFQQVLTDAAVKAIAHAARYSKSRADSGV